MTGVQTCALPILVLMKDADQVEDHKITLIGPDIDSGDLEYAMGTFIEVYGKKMQADFESVIERKIHAWFNYCLLYTSRCV